MQKRIAILTGEIVGSARSTDKSSWLDRLKESILKIECKEWMQEGRWEIYRGDSFQLELHETSKALHAALIIRSGLKALSLFEEEDMDVRISIGISSKDFEGDRVTESDGPAYHFSGRALDAIEKTEQRLILKSDWEDLDAEMQVGFALAEVILSNWSAASSEVAWYQLLEDHTQKELAAMLEISQPAVNKRLARAHLEEILLLEKRFQERVSILQT